MPTHEEIQEQLKHLDGVSKLFGRKEIKYLPEILWEDEKLEGLVQGMYGKGQGILCATNKRLVFVDKGLVAGLRVEDFAYDRITSIQYETGLVFGKINIFVAGNKAEISQIEKKQVKGFCDYVRARITGGQAHASAAAPAPVQDDVFAQLEKLGSLKNAGVLTEEEFEAKKKELLAKL